jgi:hypothetical protein
MSGEVANACMGDSTHDASDSGGAGFLKMSLPSLAPGFSQVNTWFFSARNRLSGFPLKWVAIDHLAEARC